MKPSKSSARESAKSLESDSSTSVSMGLSDSLGMLRGFLICGSRTISLMRFGSVTSVFAGAEPSS